MQPRFQVRVRPKDVARAEEVLKAALEAPAEANAAPSDTCEACGAKVQPDATECPDCGLSFVGGG
jgi:ribosomal protein L40E